MILAEGIRRIFVRIRAPSPKVPLVSYDQVEIRIRLQSHVTDGQYILERALK